MSNTLIRFGNTWVAGVSFTNEPGMRVKSMTTTRDRTKAARFATENAHAIAMQFEAPATLELADGTALLDETAALQAELAEFRQTAADTFKRRTRQ